MGVLIKTPRLGEVPLRIFMEIDFVFRCFSGCVLCQHIYCESGTFERSKAALSRALGSKFTVNNKEHFAQDKKSEFPSFRL